ncbi:MAG TPA: oligopeptide/dipeptide ABC transporter ATP-binding protein [Rhabdochlamydiaceae bacterium]
MKPVIQLRNIKKYYDGLKAVDDISFEIFPGETLGLVGESGSGKTTTGKLILSLEKPTSGDILYKEQSIFAMNPREAFAWRREVQIIFQDPYASLNPRMTAGDIIAEPLKIHHLPDNGRVEELLRLVGLNPEHRGRFPHEFSGGQRQRIGIARALAASPNFIVCDEAISALDVSVQAQILNLLKQLQEQLGLTYLFIAHDLRVVKYLSKRVAVMYLGTIVEMASSEELYSHPLHPYTEALLSAILIPDPTLEKNRSRIVLKGDIPSPLHPPKGCVFCTRCPKVMPKCHIERPPLQQIGEGHFVACHLY